jgi:tetratricopeptide (TPR) repeat protein
MMSHRVLILTSLGIVVASGSAAQPRAPMPCDEFVAAVQADPNNLEAAVALGRCSYRDYELMTLDGDSTRTVFRSSWTPALRALRRAVERDPSYSTAYRPLFSILFAETRDGCSSVTGECRYVAAVVRDGDSVVTVPRLVRLNIVPDTYDEAMQQSQNTRRANLAEARDVARRWLAVAPNDPRPHEYLGRALLHLGAPVAAAEQLELAATLGTPGSRRQLFWDRIAALILSNRGADARRVLDDAVADPARDTARLASHAIAALNELVGRYRPPLIDSARVRWRDSVLREGIATMPSVPTRIPSFESLLAAGDTNGARRLLAREDSFTTSPGAMRTFAEPREVGLWSAERHLALGDTAGALAQLGEIGRAMDDRRFRYNVSLVQGSRLWTGRAWLLLGNIAAAQGRRDEATTMYARVIGLWGGDGADGEAQPVVEQARDKLSALTRQ